MNAPPPSRDAVLVVALRRSRRLLSLLAGAHGLALAALWLSAPAAAAGVAVTLAVLLSFGYGWYRYALPGGGFVGALRIDAGGGCRLYFGDGRYRDGRLYGWYLRPSLLVLGIGGERRRWSLVIPADAADAEPLRRLRRRLSLAGADAV